MSSIVVLSKEELISTVRSLLKEELDAFKLTLAPKETVQWLSKTKAAERLGISKPTLDARIRDGIIQAHRIGNRVLFKSTDIDAAVSKIQIK